MEERVTSHLQGNQRLTGYIIFSILFVLVSIAEFYGVRLIYPILANLGRGSLFSLPAVFTYLMPVVGFYLILVAMYSKTIKGRLRFIAFLGYALLAISIFDLVDVTLCCVLVFNGEVIVDFITPAYPLDVILLNSVYFLCGICALMYRRIDKKYVLSVGTSKIPLSTNHMVVFAILLPFVAYYFGQFMSGLYHIKDLVMDKNWAFMLPHYLAFLLPTIYFGLYMWGRYIKDKEKRYKLGMGGLIFAYTSSLIVLIWAYAGMIVNPYLIAESLSYEYALGLLIKIPFGIFIVTFICVALIIAASVKLIKFGRKPYEQKQEKI